MPQHEQERLIDASTRRKGSLIGKASYDIVAVTTPR
jgi:hypothetical protein